jgi:hypothetical protein
VIAIKKCSVLALSTALLFVADLVSVAHAQENDDPPSRVARLAYLEGAVSFRPGGTDDWVDPGLNRPLTVGDQLWSDQGRAELQLDGSRVRLGEQTSASILNLNDHVTQIQLSSGTLIVQVRRLEDDESYEIDTPNVAFSILRPGVYRLTVDGNGQSTAIAVRRGQGEATGGGSAYTVRANDYDTFTGTNPVEADTQPLNGYDDFDSWSDARDEQFNRSPSARYVSNDVIGYEDLDNQGNWDEDQDYGHVWYPNVEAGWAPYHVGHWAYIAPWGYTWVDDRPWGFAPFHYGRWICPRGRWGWVPAPPRLEGVAYVRPVYAPALVAWVGGAGAGAAVAWFPLAPREVFVPSYPVSRRYLNEVNVSNTRINTTVINNVYNTTVINKTTINNITYVNQRVPGAVAATNAQAFTSAQPVARNRANIDARALESAPVRSFAPAVVPTKEAVLGARGPARSHPPVIVTNRVTTARLAPATPPPSFAQRQVAIRENGGEAPNRAQLARLAPAPTRLPEVRMAPPVHTLVTAHPEEHNRLAPAAVQSRAPEPVVHPNDAPFARPQSPAVANSVLERQHYQEQQDLLARQQAERARIQAQQEQEHHQLQEQQAQQQRMQQEQQAERLRAAQAEQAAERQRELQAQAEQQRAAQAQALEAQRLQREREIEAQHQQQTQALMQEHLRQQQEMQARQQEQARAQAVQAPPHKPNTPPKEK